MPAKTPQPIINKIHADTVAAVADPPTRKKLEEMGVVASGSTPADLAAQVKADVERWGPLIREAGISLRN